MSDAALEVLAIAAAVVGAVVVLAYLFWSWRS
jgi:hypothetical protein